MRSSPRASAARFTCVEPGTTIARTPDARARIVAKLGDKTLLDALIPVHETLKEHAAAETPDHLAALKQSADAAETAIDATRSLVAHRGRASQVGERSANTPDPGIVAIAKILHDWCTEFGVARTATVAEVVAAS